MAAQFDLVIDHRPNGGTCALRGCDLKEMLISGGEAVDNVRRMHGHGVEGAVQVDWPALMAFKRSFTDPIPAAQELHYTERGIDAFRGIARSSARTRSKSTAPFFAAPAFSSSPAPGRGRWGSAARNASPPASSFLSSIVCPRGSR